VFPAELWGGQLLHRVLLLGENLWREKVKKATSHAVGDEISPSFGSICPTAGITRKLPRPHDGGAVERRRCRLYTPHTDKSGAPYSGRGRGKENGEADAGPGAVLSWAFRAHNADDFRCLWLNETFPALIHRQFQGRRFPYWSADHSGEGYLHIMAAEDKYTGCTPTSKGVVWSNAQKTVPTSVFSVWPGEWRKPPLWGLGRLQRPFRSAAIGSVGTMRCRIGAEFLGHHHIVGKLEGAADPPFPCGIITLLATSTYRVRTSSGQSQSPRPPGRGVGHGAAITSVFHNGPPCFPTAPHLRRTLWHHRLHRHQA